MKKVISKKARMQVRCPAHVHDYVMLTYVLVTIRIIRFAHEEPECDAGVRERVMDTCNINVWIRMDARGSALVDMI